MGKWESILAIIFYFLITNGLGIIMYILQGVALYTIADRRGIANPWLAWIPVGNMWILGSISDQYRYVSKGQIKNNRKMLLGLEIGFTLLAVFLIVFVLIGLFEGFVVMEPATNVGETPVDTGTAIGMILALIVILVASNALGVLGIAFVVFFYIALYDVYQSTSPHNSKLYLILSIVGGRIINGLYSLFLFLCRHQEGGMPSRKNPGDVSIGNKPFIPVTEFLDDPPKVIRVNTEE
jgi:hypothetical protein